MMYQGEVIVSMIGTGATGDAIRPDVPDDWGCGLVTIVQPDLELISPPATASVIVYKKAEQFFIDLGGDCLWYVSMDEDITDVG